MTDFYHSQPLPMLDSPQNPRVKGWKQALGKRRGDIIAIESRHPVEEALRQGLAITDILVADADEWQALSASVSPVDPREDSIERPRPYQVWLASPRVLSALSSTTQPPPVMAMATRPSLLSLADFWQTMANQPEPCRVLWLHQLQDPGNVGTLIRSARAFGIHGILLGQPMVDVFSPKVIRSTAGWGFGLPMAAITNITALSLPNTLQDQSLQWYLTTGQHPNRTVIAHTKLHPQLPWVCVLGNEGAGLPDSFLTEIEPALPPGHTAQWVTIPTAVESLNVGVSGSILMAHLHSLRS